MKINLSLKIIIVIVAVSGIFLASLAWQHIQTHKEIMKESYISEAELVAYALDASIHSKEELEDRTELLNHLYKHIWLNLDILEIEVNIPSRDGLTNFISTEPDLIGKELDESNMDSYKDDILISKTIPGEKSEIIRVITPIHISGKREGTYQIDFTLEEYEKKIKNEITYLVLVYLVLILFFILTLFYLIKAIIIKPIQKINKGLQYVAKGNLNYKISVNSKDEIGELAETFDEMRLALKDRNDLLNSLLKTFRGKFGNIATIIVRKNVEQLIDKNPRIAKFLPKSLRKLLRKKPKISQTSNVER